VLSRSLATSGAAILGVLAGAALALGPAQVAAAAPAACGLVAHRGDHTLSTENSTGAVRAAVGSGADYVEVDVRAAADGTLFLMHDRRVDRTTDGVGRIDRKTRAEVRALRLDDGTRVPTLHQALEIAGTGDIDVIVEMKAMGGLSSYRDLKRQVRAFGSQRVRVTSFSAQRLQTLRSIAPRIPQGIVSWTALPPEEVAPYDAILVEHTAMTDEWLTAMPHPVLVWTPGPAEWGSWVARVRAVITDDTAAFEAYREVACAEPPPQP
jgi:glycerophosphoryl diester phosphodiesterase